MLNSQMYLSSGLWQKEIEKDSIRQGFGQGLLEAGQRDQRVVALTADLKESTQVTAFAREFPDRFFDCGVAEQALVTVGSGLANSGKIPFCTSYAVFSPGRNWEQIRTTIALNDVPVKIVGSHAGVNVGPDGATHQGLEDVALMRVLPNMVVLVPADTEEARKATLAAAQDSRPNYIRLTREKSPVITTTKTPFKIGRAQIFWQSRGPEAAIIAAGPVVYEALLAAHELEKAGIETMVVNCATIKPLDEALIVQMARRTGALVTVEEHQIAGGLGSAVAEILARSQPTPLEFVGVNDSFGESGQAEELLAKFHLKSPDIIAAVKKVIARKNS